MTRIKALLIGLVLVMTVAIIGGTHDPWDGTLWDTASPDIDQLIGNHYKEIYDLRKGVAVRMNKEHVTLATSSAGGEHKQGSAVAWHLATASIPALQPDGTALAATDNGRLWHDITTDIFYVLDDYSDPTVDGGWIGIGNYLGGIAVNTDKFTVARATGNTAIDGTLDVNGVSVFTGLITANAGVTLGAGDDLIGSATSDITINTNKFTVAGASGNTVVAGTLDVTGNIDPTTYENTNGGFLDEDDMSSDLATATASQQSIKAYVDASSADGYTPASYAGGESSTRPDGLIFKGGYKARGGSATTVTFGAAFPTAILTCVCTNTDAGTGTIDNPVRTKDVATTGFVAYIPDAEVDGFYWFAMGY